MTTKSDSNEHGMSKFTARTIEYAIIALCLIALTMIFQPYDIRFFSVGAALVVVAGLAFNLIPFCTPGTSLRALGKAALIVIVTLLIITAFAIGSAYLYGIYLRNGG